MPFLQNNMNHFISENNENYYLTNYADEYEGSRINVVLEYDVFWKHQLYSIYEARRLWLLQANES